MTVKLRSPMLQGVIAHPIDVEVDLLRRLPCVVIVGLPGGTVRESADRVRSAITESGFEFPKMRVVINLAPADMPKTGTNLDLAMAVGILLASKQLPADYDGIPWERIFFHGELSLSGEVRSARGGAAAGAMVAQQEGCFLMGSPEVAEMAKAMGAQALPLPHLSHLVGPRLRSSSSRVAPVEVWQGARPIWPVLSDIRGHSEELLDQLALAASTRQTIILRGAPGCGKTMIASRLAQLLGPLPLTEQREVFQIHEAAGLVNGQVPETVRRPFRAPHHTVSASGLIGTIGLRPGELTLAHRGVLFLDELAEFSQHAIELLRGAHERREVVVTRASGTVRMPADCWLVAAVNPCFCGFSGSVSIPCECSPAALERYTARWKSMLPDAVVIDVPTLSREAVVNGAPWPDRVAPPL